MRGGEEKRMSEFDTNLDVKTVKTLEETDKKCPDCGGVMDFDPATGGLCCPYCGHTETIVSIPILNIPAPFDPPVRILRATIPD